MFLAFDLLLDLDVEDGVRAGDLGVSVKLDARGTQQLGTVEALGRRLAVFVVDHLADVAERILRRPLSAHHLHNNMHSATIPALFHVFCCYDYCTFMGK